MISRFAPAPLVVAFLLALAPLSSLAVPLTLQPTRSFDEGWRELEQLEQLRPPPGSTQVEAVLALSQRARRMTRLAWELFEEHPQDPRRWTAAVKLIRTTSGYIYEISGDPQKDGPGAYKRDAVAQVAWSAYARAVYEQLLAAPGVPEETVMAAIDAMLYRLNMTVTATSAEQRAVIDEFARRFPDHPQLASHEQRYYMRLQHRDPAAAAEQIQHMLRSSNAAVREKAEGMARLQTGEEIQLKFTALDGREVDLAALRGKVVLVDFWATWCGPCVAELPNVKKVYEQYHDRGFEIIGISLDSERDRQKLIDFCRERELPWPQHYDGRGWKNEFAQKFSVSAIPAMLLIDKEGRVASNNARGEKLEAEVKRLLGL